VKECGLNELEGNTRRRKWIIVIDIKITDDIICIQMSNVYENIIEEFNKRGCTLITTKEEHSELILKYSTKLSYKLNYIASCGHNHNVFYNVFKSRGTGIKCPSCKYTENGKIKKEMFKNEIFKLSNINQENDCIIKLIGQLNKDFEIVKAFDGCVVDMIYKPIGITEDTWVGIQIKTTNSNIICYSFNLQNHYKNCLILCFDCINKNIWIFPENYFNQTKISIGFTKSKYNVFKVEKSNLISCLYNYYVNTSKFTFDELNLPINIFQQREQEYRKFREEKIDFLKFEYDNKEGTVYDFKIGKNKIQEKVTCINNETKMVMFQLCKHNGIINRKKMFCQYDIGDNDFYWLNVDNKKTFFVFPEQLFIDRGIIGNTKTTKFFKITLKEKIHKISEWIIPYMFDYENIDSERLLALLM
jgi:hypothetical protein